MKLLSIDPGLKITGWAVFCNNEYLCSSVIRIKNKELSWLQKLDSIIIKFANLLCSYKIDMVVIEEPELFISSMKGRAASNSGAVMKLTALVHSMRVVAKLKGIKVVLAPVRKWKGNVPKKITQRRIKRHWGWVGKSEDEADAVGLGGWYIRKVLGVKSPFEDLS